MFENRTGTIILAVAFPLVFLLAMPPSFVFAGPLDELGDMLGFDGGGDGDNDNDGRHRSNDNDTPSRTDSAPELVVLSHGYDESSFLGELKGELLNAGTSDYNKFEITLSPTFTIGIMFWSKVSKGSLMSGN